MKMVTDFPAPVSLPRPTYPPAARAVRATGEVEVVLTIASDGSVESAQARTGHPLLRAASVVAAKRAKFTPAASLEKLSAVLVFVFLPVDEKEAIKVRHRNPFRIEVFSENAVINTMTSHYSRGPIRLPAISSLRPTPVYAPRSRPDNAD